MTQVIITDVGKPGRRRVSTVDACRGRVIVIDVPIVLGLVDVANHHTGG